MSSVPISLEKARPAKQPAISVSHLMPGQEEAPQRKKPNSPPPSSFPKIIFLGVLTLVGGGLAYFLYNQYKKGEGIQNPIHNTQAELKVMENLKNLKDSQFMTGEGITPSSTN